MAQKSVIKDLKRYIALLESEGIPIEKAYLYGSYARNEETPDSDIDILLVTKDIELNNDRIWGKAWILTKKINTKIEPYLVSLNKFLNDDYSPLIQIVKKEGIAVS